LSLPLKNILFATDFSPNSEAALAVVRALAVRSAPTVHFVHVVAPLPKSQAPIDRPPELDLEQADAEDAMQLLLAGESWRGIAHTSTVQRGHVSEVLASLVEEKNIDLIVLGTHGRRGLKKLVLGSTAEQVIRMADCPVLTVGPHAKHVDEAQSGPAPVLYATDFSAGARRALRCAASWARANRSRLVLVHAVQPMVEVPSGDVDPMPVKAEFSAEVMAGAEAYANRQLAELIAAEKLQELGPETVVAIGAPAGIILSTAQKKNAGLIVMGAHRAWSQSVAAHLPWAMASVILCEAPCPVMTVRD
jgi:nucleotide-binding universal stress UspA family protein